MPAPATVDELLALVRKSQVTDDKALQDCLQRLRAAGSVPDSPGALATALVRQGLLSHFQAEQLMQGKWRGFFIGRYRILEQLGSGGMGNVFLGEHAHMHRLVAIKVLPFEMAKNPSTLQRFYREARAGAALDHPNIVRSYDIDQNERLHFLAMEYVDGSSLQEIVKRHGPMSVLRACHYVKQAALGLQHAHESGLIHRDIKPGNLLLDRAGTVKVLDMGLARFLHDKEDNLTRKYDETVLGTADYFSPEQAIDSHTVDIRADIYSLGATFYFLLTGHPPFEEANMMQKLLWHQTKQPKSIKTYRNDVPDALLAIIDKMMAKKTDDRYQTPAEVVEALAPYTNRPIPPPADQEMPRLSPVVQRAVQSQPASSPPMMAPASPPPAPRRESPVSPRPRAPQPSAPLPAVDSGITRSGARPVVATPPPANANSPRPTPTQPVARPTPSSGKMPAPRPPTKVRAPAPAAQEKDTWTPPTKVVVAIVIGCLLLGILVILLFWYAAGTSKDTIRSSAVNPAPATVAAAVPPTGLLQASTANPPKVVDLTAEGSLDWVHWGKDAIEGINRKKDVTALINTWSRLGPGKIHNYNNNLNQFAWKDGSPTPTAAINAGIYAEKVGTGFSLSVGADQVPRSLRIYVGAFKATGKMEAALSDNSAPPFVASGPTRKDGPITLVYAFQYRATSAAQKLLVKYTLGEDFAGNVTLQAATLAMAPADVK